MSVRWILPGTGVDYTLEIEGRVVSAPEASGGARGSALWLRPRGFIAAIARSLPRPGPRRSRGGIPPV